MPKLVTVLFAGLLAGIAATWFVMRAEKAPAADEVVRDLVATETVTTDVAEQHRSEGYRALGTIADVLALPRRFDQLEALYALAGRSDAAATQALIFEANRIAEPVQRAEVLDGLFIRLTELDAQSALALARTEYFRGDRDIEDTIWAAWSRRSLDDALFAAATQPNDRLRHAAAQSLYKAFGDDGNATTRRIEEELAIPPDLETRGRYVRRLADRSVPAAIDYLNAMTMSFDKLDLTLRFANYLSIVNPEAALANVERIEDVTHRTRVRNILEAAVARNDPLGVIERVIGEGGNPGRSAQFRHAMTALAANDMDQAIALFEGATGAEARLAIGSTIASIMAGKDPDAAIEWVKANQHSPTEQFPYSSIELSLLNSLARHDPARAVVEAQSLVEPMRQPRLLRALFNSMGFQDARSAVGLVGLVEDREAREQVEVYLAQSWMQRDTEAALDWVLGLGEERAAKILAQTRGLDMTQDLDAAMRYLPRLPADYQRQARRQIAERLAMSRSVADAQAFVRQFESEPDYAELQASLIEGVVRNDPTLAVQMADGIGDTRARDAAYLAIVRNLANSDPRQAADWLDRIGDESTRLTGISEVARLWANRDIDEAVQWAKSQPSGPGRDDAVGQVARQWESGGEQALELAGTIENEFKRGQAQIWIVIRLAGDDPDRASEMIGQLDLSPSMREQANQWLVQIRRRY